MVFDPDTGCVSDVAPLMDFATGVFLEIPEEEDCLLECLSEMIG